MSTTVDERVVEMRFDNRNFESNVQTSMTTLEKLKKSLRMDGVSKGLEDVGKAANSMDFSKTEMAATRAGFHIRDVFEKTTRFLENDIARRIVDVGKNLTKAFTIDPVKTGFNEYELKMGSVQTIMASTGESLETVNKYLEELNTYSDKTIYSFSDMTQNIGKFTNAGVKLEDAVAAIKGVSNEAAVSGANAQEASRAMYNFAQALSAGYVKLIDWKSIENANMATVEFKQQLIDTAVEVGTLVKVEDKYKTTTTDANGKVSELFDSTHSFNEALSNQWMTTEVLTKTLSKYADETTDIGKKAYAAAQDVKTFSMMMDTLKEAAQSGWAQTWELIVGDFEEAKTLFTEASNFFGGIIDNASKARNSFLGGALNNVVGAEDWDALKKAGVASKNFKKLIKEVAKSHNVDIDSMIKSEGSFEETLKNGWLTEDIYSEAIENLSDAERKLIKQEAEGIKNSKERIAYIKELTRETKKADKPYTDLLKKLERPSGRELLIDTLRNSLKALITEIRGIKNAWSDVFPKKTSEDLYNIIKRLHDFSVYLTKIDEDGTKLGRTFRGLFSVVHVISNLFGGAFKIGLKVVQAILSHFNCDILDVTASIGDALYNFDKWIEKNDFIVKGVDAVITIIEKSITGIAKWINTIKEIPEVQTGIKKFNDSFALALEAINKKVEGVGERFGAFIERLKALNHISLDNIGSIIKDFYENVILYMFDFNRIFNNAKKSFEDFRQSLSDGKFKGIKNTIFGFVSDIKDKLEEFNILGSLLTIGTGVVIFKSVKKVMNIFEKIGGFAEALKAPLKSLSGLLNQVKDTLKAYAFELKSKAILNIAFAIAVLAGSLAVLSLCDSKKLLLSAGALLVVSLGLTALCTVLGKFNAIDIGKVSLSFIAISGALLVLVVALKKLESIESDGLKNRLILLAGLAAGLVVFGGIASLIPGINKGAVSMLAFGVALRVMLNALQKINEIEIEDPEKTTNILIRMIEAIGVMSLLCRGLNVKDALGLAGIVIALRMFVTTFKKITDIDPEQIQKGMSGLLGIFGSFALIMLAAKLAGQNSAKAGAMMLMISVSLLIMIKAIKKIGKLSAHDVEKGVGAVTGLLMVFGIVVALSKFAGQHAAKAGAMLLGMSGTFLAVTVAMAILGKMKDDQIDRAMKAIKGVSACFALLIASTGLSKVDKGTKSALLAMTIAIAAMTAALGALSFIDPTRLKSATFALSTVMAMFAAINASTKFISKDATKPLAMMSAVVTVLGGVIFLLGQLPTDSAIESAKSLSLILLVMTGSLILVSKLPQDISVAPLYFMSGVVTILAVILGVMSAFDVEASINSALSISTLLLAMSGALTIISILPKNVSTAPLYVISGVVAILAAILGAMDALNVEASMNNVLAISTLLLAMSATCAILSIVGNAAGAAISGAAALVAVIGIIGAVAYGVGALFDQDWCNLSYIEKGFDVLSAITYGLGKVIGDFVGGISDGVMSGLPAIGTYLTEFTNNAGGFLECITNLDSSVATSAKNLASALLCICGAELLQTLTGWLVGDANMEEFGEKLTTFAEGIVSFSDTVKGKIDSEAVETATNAGKLITELAKSVPNSGGLLGMLAGNNEVDKFGKKLQTFAQGIVDFSETVKGKIDSYSVETAVNTGKMITELSSSVPNSGGLLGMLAGNNEVDKFGGKLKKFAEGIVDFSETVKGKIDSDSVNTAVNAGKMITGLADSVPESGGWAAAIFGDNDVGEFGEKLITFGEALATFCTGELSKVSIYALEGLVNRLAALLNIIDQANDADTKNIKNFNKALKELAKASIDGFIESFSTETDTTVNAINAFLDQALSAVRTYYTSFYTVGNNVSTGFISGLSYKVDNGDVYAAGYKLGEKVLKAAKDALDIHSPSREMKKVGAFAIDGFVEGLTTKGVKLSNVTDAVFKNFTAKALEEVTTTKTAKSIIESYAKSYATNIKNINKQRKIAAKTITAYTQQVYKSSSYYKDDKKNLNDHLKQLKKYYSERTKLKKQLAKANANEKKNIQNSIKENAKNIKSMKKQIDKDQQQMVKNTKKALDEVKKAIKDSVKDYVSIFNAASNKINLFGSSELTGKSAIKSSILDSLSGLTSLSNFSLDTGIDMLTKFSSNTENLVESVNSAKDELAEANEDLANAENELLVAQTKSLAVNGRSQKYLEQIAEAEEKVAQAKERVAQAEENLNKITKSSGTEMVENMKSNIDAYNAWQKDLEDLSKTSISASLLAHLKGLGISGAEQVSAFVKMTKDELAQANTYWAEHSSISTKTLVDGMKDKSTEMIKWGENIKLFTNLKIDDEVKTKLLQEFQSQGIDSADYLNQILSMSAKELDDFVKSYKTMITVPEAVADQVSKSIDKVNKKTANAKKVMDDYLNTMRENLKAEKEYEKNLKALKKNGVSDGLYDQIVSSGDKQLIASFAKASKEEIKEANAIFKESAKQTADSWLTSYTERITDAKEWEKNMKKFAKLDIPKKMKETLYEEFKNKGIESNETLEMILGFTNKQLNSFVKNYKEAGNTSTSIADAVIAGSASVSTETQKNFNNSMKKSAKEAMTALDKEIEANKPKIKKTSKSVGTSAVNEIGKSINKTSGEQLGNDMCSGLVNGFNNKIGDVKAAAFNLGKEVLSSAKKAVKSKSPAKKFIELGKNCDEGLAIGLNKYSALSENAANATSGSVLTTMQDSINKISAWANSGIETSPTIRPILDMSEIQRQASSIRGMFGSESIGVNANMASSIANRMYSSYGSQNGSTTNNSYDQSTQTINNTFNITGDNPKEIANEVSKILQKQVNRRSLTWA